MGLEIGDQPPVFTARDEEGNQFSLADHLGKRPLVLFFYPKDFTPGCTTQACSFRDQYTEFEKAGALVIGISSDQYRRHKQFASNYRLPYPLLEDQGGKISKLFRVPSHFFGLVPGRATFVINSAGILAAVIRKSPPASHAQKALEILNSIA